MNAHDLAKELRALALKIDALTYEAREALAAKLELERRKGYPQKRANKWDPAPLTVGAIKAALDITTARPSTSVELRKDVFERRCEKNSLRFADLFEASVKAGAAAPNGTSFAPSYTIGERRAISDATSKWGKTPINADAHAWTLAARYVLGRIVPAYCWREIRYYAERALDGAEGSSVYRLEEKISGVVDRWLNANTILLCDVDQAGQVVRINGLDPAPFVELRKLAAASPDPWGILTTS